MVIQVQDFWIDFGFSTVFTMLRAIVTDEKKKAAMKKLFLKLHRNIGAAYADDPDFAAE